MLIHRQNFLPRAAIPNNAARRRGETRRKHRNHRHGHVKREDAPFPNLAADRQFAAHHAHERSADCQAQPRAFGVILRRADLIERLENIGEFLRRNADAGVRNLEMQRRGGKRARRRARSVLLTDGRALADAKRHFPVFRIFHRVIQNVQQHLPQPLFVNMHAVRHVRAEIRRKPQPFLMRPNVNHVRQFRQKAGEIEVNRTQDHLLRLDFGHVQNVVNHFQQMLSAMADRLKRLALPLKQRRFLFEQLRIA